jgi:P22 coat protein - gene protein 5
MPNKFSKQEKVMFGDYTQAFDDALRQVELFNRFNQDGEELERSRNTIWRTIPPISTTVSGFDITSSLDKDSTELSFPTSLNANPENATFQLNGAERRDKSRMRRLAKAQLQALASKINRDAMNICSLQGSIVLTKNSSAVGFDDVADIDTRLNQLGVALDDRKVIYSSSDYQKMASNLAQRVLDNKHSVDALRAGMVGRLSDIDTYKAQYALRLTPATAVAVTATGLPLAYTPLATTNTVGGQINIDSRVQQINITLTAGANFKVGDCIRFVGTDEVHHISKVPTGLPKTFRITATPGGGGTGVIEISPPMIATGEYQNVTAAPAIGAAIVPLNTAAAYVNPFWQGDAFEIMPGMVEFDSDAPPLTYTSDVNGLVVSMFKESNMGKLNTNYRFTVWYGLVCTNPQMAGVQLFNQV